MALATMMPFTLPFLGIGAHLIADLIDSLLIFVMILFKVDRVRNETSAVYYELALPARHYVVPASDSEVI